MEELNLQVAASGDDSGTTGGSFTFNSTEAASYVGSVGGGNYQIWSRFAGVAIPQGATITSAVLSLYVVDGGSNFGTAKFKSLADNTDNHTSPISGADANGRTLTAGTAWPDITSKPPVNSWISADITAELQAVINRAGWVSGNAIGIRTIENGSTINTGQQIRNYDNDPTKAAKLVITYELPPSGSTPRDRRRTLLRP